MTVSGKIDNSSLAIMNDIKRVLDQLKGIVFTYDGSGRITYCTQRGAEVFGLTIKEMIGKRIADLVPKDESMMVQKAIEEEDGVGRIHEITITDNDKNKKRFHIQVIPLASESGSRGGIVVASDISDWTQAQKNLMNSEMRYRRLFENSFDGIAVFDINGRCLDCNQAFADLLGHPSKEAVISRSYKKITPAEYHDLDIKAMMQILERGYCDEYIKEYLHSDGTRVVTSIRGLRSTDEDGNTIGGWYLVHDITEKKRAEEKLRRSEELYRTIFENTGTAMMIFDEDTTIISINKETERLTGISRQDTGKIKWTDLVYPEDLEKMMGFYKAGREPGNKVPRNYEFRMVRKDGAVREVSLTAAMIPDSKQAIISLVDVTEARWAERRMRAANEELEATLEELTAIEEELRQQYQELQKQETALAESERRFRSLLENVRLVALIIDAEGTITFVNNFLLSLIGWEREELEGRHFTVLFPSSIQKRMKRLFETTIKKERVISYGPSYVQTKDGRKLRIHWNNTLLMDTERNVAGIATIGEDVTERWRAEKELQKNLEQMQALLDGTVEALAATAEKRDPYTAGHQRRVADLACAIGRKMGIDGSRLEGLRTAGILHDIGKMYIPTEILSKPGRLTEVEMLLVRTHCQAGYEILRKIPFTHPVPKILLQHHERLDGSGYPQGLRGGEILLEARILGVADVVEAMASHRPYRPALGVAKALEEISANSGILYDSQVVQVCCRLFSEEGFTFDP
jgi:PAS domain S-box-containing protein/putative nucleotidyltransferase with HDIG domain